MKNVKFICTQHPEYDAHINENVQFEDGCYDWHSYAGGIYLHGDVEKANGYDCVSLISADDIKYYRHTDSCGTTVERPDFPTGIFECEVFGYPNKCKAFIWCHSYGNYKSFKGLIVDTNDAVSLSDAQQKFDKRAYCI